MLTSLYEKNYPKSIHKIPNTQLIQVKTDLVDSYVDDLNTGASLYDIQSELTQPTFCHDQTPFKQLRIEQQAELITISKGLKLLHVLNFTGFSIKKFSSNSYIIQNTLNADTRLQTKNLNHTEIRPDQAKLESEILTTRQQSTLYANTDPPDHPLI